VPIYDALEALFRFSQLLLSHARAYSQNKKVIEKEHIIGAIIYLDSRNRIGDIVKVVMAEKYSKSRKNGVRN
jgi:hypothetical protein